jgi:V8-like Glu-specific endopeptidase
MLRRRFIGAALTIGVIISGLTPSPTINQANAAPLYIGTPAYRIPNAPASGPQSGIASLSQRFINNSTGDTTINYLCTAWFYGTSAAASAAHCLHDAATGGIRPLDRWHFRVALNSNSNSQLRWNTSCDLKKDSNGNVQSGAVKSGPISKTPTSYDDWAVFRTGCSVSAVFPVLAWEYVAPSYPAVWVTGYSKFTPYGWPVGSMVEDYNETRKVFPKALEHDADTWDGASGGPVFKTNCGVYGSYCSVGMHIGYQPAQIPGTARNYGHLPDQGEVNIWACVRDTTSTNC